MSKGVVWYDNVALNFKAWLGGVITTVPITTIATPVPTTQGGTGTSTTFPSGRVVVTTTGGVYTSNANFLWDTTLEAVGLGAAPAAGDRLLVSGNVRIAGATSQLGFPNSNGTKIDLTNGGASIIVQEASWGIQIGAGVGQGASTGFVRIVTGDGELMRVGGGIKVALKGLLDISDSAAGQIKFPASQNASSDANTLDDYEEGTWTPVIGGSGGESGQAYSIQVGNYVKVGQLVTAFCIVQLSTKGTITTFVQIKGLPFTSKNVANTDQPITMSYFVNLGNTFTSLAGILQENATAAFVAGVPTAATGVTLLATADISNTTQLVFSVSYRATA